MSMSQWAHLVTLGGGGGQLMLEHQDACPPADQSEGQFITLGQSSVSALSQNRFVYICARTAAVWDVCRTDTHVLKQGREVRCVRGRTLLSAAHAWPEPRR